MNLFEKLNRLDDSLVESKRVVKKTKLTESVEDDKKKLFDAAASVKCKLDNDTIEYAMYDVDDFIENELVYCGKLLLSECPDMLFWRYVSDENFGSYCAVYESDEDFADAFYQISHDRVYDITDEVNDDYNYDDDIDEMLTEGGYDPYPAGKYGDLIFNILDSCSGDAIINFMHEYQWPFYESGDSISDVYDKINKYLDTHSGYGLWSDLDKHFN